MLVLPRGSQRTMLELTLLVSRVRRWSGRRGRWVFARSSLLAGAALAATLRPACSDGDACTGERGCIRRSGPAGWVIAPLTCLARDADSSELTTDGHRLPGVASRDGIGDVAAPGN